MTEHIEDLLPGALRSKFAGVRVVTELPASLESAVPLLQVVGIGGSGDRLQFDNQRVDIDAFAATRSEARDLAQRLHDWLLRDLPGQMLGTATFVLTVSEFLAPTWTPYDNTDVRRFTCSVQINTHNRSAA